MTDPTGYGQNTPNDSTDPFNSTDTQVRRILANVRTAHPVRVTAVRGPDGGEIEENSVVPYGFVCVQPLVRMQNGVGDTAPMNVVNNVPFSRSASGLGAIICDPKVGDIGTLVVCDRDISSVKASQDEANPGSRRQFSMADGVFFPSMLNGGPVTNRIQFRTDGIDMTPDDGETLLSLRAGKITLKVGTSILQITTEVLVGWVQKAILHGIEAASIDVDGTGFQIEGGIISAYGGPPIDFPSNPPAVPLAEANEPEAEE